MSEDQRWQFELEEYIRQGEPEKSEPNTFGEQKGLERAYRGAVLALQEDDK